MTGHVHPWYIAGWVRYGMTHENPSRRMTKALALSSNISVDILYVIHPKYILSEPFYKCFIKFLYDRSRLSAYTVSTVPYLYLTAQVILVPYCLGCFLSVYL
jgi:hypothetical protein